MRVWVVLNRDVDARVLKRPNLGPSWRVIRAGTRLLTRAVWKGKLDLSLMDERLMVEKEVLVNVPREWVTLTFPSGG